MDVHNLEPKKLCIHTNVHESRIVFLTVFRQNAILFMRYVKVM